MKNKRVGSLVILALMIGLNIVLSRFVSIKAMNFKIVLNNDQGHTIKFN